MVKINIMRHSKGGLLFLKAHLLLGILVKMVIYNKVEAITATQYPTSKTVFVGDTVTYYCVVEEPLSENQILDWFIEWEEDTTRIRRIEAQVNKTISTIDRPEFSNRGLYMTSWHSAVRNSDSKRIHTCTLTINTVTLRDRGHFGCTHQIHANDQHRTLLQNRALLTIYPIKALDPECSKMDHGTSWQLLCIASGGDPAAFVTWYEGTSTVAFSGVTNDNLQTITVTKGSNDRMFTCETRQGTLPIKMCHISIEGDDAPYTGVIPAQDPECSKIDHGTSWQLLCIASGGDPAASVTWYEDSLAFSVSNEHFQLITIGKDSVKNTRSFTCESQQGTLSRKMCSIILQMETSLGTTTTRSPVNHIIPAQDPDCNQIDTGMWWQLSCTAIGGEPPASVIWYEGATSLALSTSYESYQAVSVPKYSNIVRVFKCEAQQGTLPPKTCYIVIQADEPTEAPSIRTTLQRSATETTSTKESFEVISSASTTTNGKGNSFTTPTPDIENVELVCHAKQTNVVAVDRCSVTIIGQDGKSDNKIVKPILQSAPSMNEQHAGNNHKNEMAKTTGIVGGTLSALIVILLFLLLLLWFKKKQHTNTEREIKADTQVPSDFRIEPYCEYISKPPPRVYASSIEMGSNNN